MSEVARRLLTPTAAGFAVWIGAMAMLPGPVAARIMLLAPLVIVPRLLGAIGERRWVRAMRGWPALLTALPLLVAFSLSTGPVAAAFVLPWLATALVGATAATAHVMAGLPSVLRPRELPRFGVDVALGFLGVGAVFTLIDRLGIDTGFSPIIVLLTATHFHSAGFGLLALASFASAIRPWLRASILGLAFGIPVTALGFTLRSDAIGAIGAWLVGLSGIAVAVGWLATRTVDSRVWLFRLAGVALLIGMPMGIAWSLAVLTGQQFIDLDTMVRSHGALNAFAVLAASLAIESPEP